MSGRAAGFQADRMMRLSLGLVRSFFTTCAKASVSSASMALSY